MEERPLLRTKLCDLLAIDWPVIQAPMAGGITTPELVAAVSNAGCLGSLAGSLLPPDELRRTIHAVRALTDKPFAVNFLLAPPEPGKGDVEGVQSFLDGFRAELGLPPGVRDLVLPPPGLERSLQVVLDEGVPVLSVALGDPAGLVGPAHEAGAVVVAMVTSVTEAVRVAAAGVDAVVAQGAEAGGHRSVLDLGPSEEPPLVGTLALVPQVVDAIAVPTVAAGGIADGRGLAAALALGAAGAQVGTRFLVARESGAFAGWKEALLEAVETDTVVTRHLSGRPARVLRNRLAGQLLSEGPPPLPWPSQGAAAFDLYQAARNQGRADLYSLYAGQALRLLKRDQTATEIVDELLAGARARSGDSSGK